MQQTRNRWRSCCLPLAVLCIITGCGEAEPSAGVAPSVALEVAGNAGPVQTTAVPGPSAVMIEAIDEQSAEVDRQIADELNATFKGVSLASAIEALAYPRIAELDASNVGAIFKEGQRWREAVAALRGLAPGNRMAQACISLLGALPQQSPLGLFGILLNANDMTEEQVAMQNLAGWGQACSASELREEIRKSPEVYVQFGFAEATGYADKAIYRRLRQAHKVLVGQPWSLDMGSWLQLTSAERCRLYGECVLKARSQEGTEKIGKAIAASELRGWSSHDCARMLALLDDSVIGKEIDPATAELVLESAWKLFAKFEAKDRRSMVPLSVLLLLPNAGKASEAWLRNYEGNLTDRDLETQKLGALVYICGGNPKDAEKYASAILRLEAGYAKWLDAWLRKRISLTRKAIESRDAERVLPFMVAATDV
jgi:hypothetical protein